MACCDPSSRVGFVRPAGCSPPPPAPCPGAEPGPPAQLQSSVHEPEHPAALCPGPPGVPCPHVSDTGPGPERALPPCPRRPALQTAQQIGHQGRIPLHMATDGVLARAKYETLPDHLNDLAASEILSSDRFKSTASESFTFKRRDRCLNPEPIFSPAPPSGTVTFLKDTEERLTQSTLPASKARFSEYSEAFGARRLSCADMVGRVGLQRGCLSRPSTDVLPKHVYTATTGVAAEVNPFLSTTRKDFQPVSAETARRYRDPPSIDTFSGDLLLPAEAVPQPRWHGFTPTVPHGGLRSEVQQRYCWPPRHSGSVRVSEAPLVVPPTTRQLLGEAQFERESDNYGTGRHNPVSLSCRGLVSQQHYRHELCNLRLDGPQPGRPTCLRSGPLATRGPADQVERRSEGAGVGNISDNHYGLTTEPPPRAPLDVN